MAETDDTTNERPLAGLCADCLSRGSSAGSGATATPGKETEGEMGLGCVAVPIFDSRRRVVAALSLTGTTRQISTARLPALGRLVKKYARQMSARLKN